jgi:hypothetical protein
MPRGGSKFREQDALASVEALVVRPRVARRMLGDCGNERLWQLINSGEIRSFLDGKARRISVPSIKEYIDRQLALQSSSRARVKSTSRRSNDQTGGRVPELR